MKQFYKYDLGSYWIMKDSIGGNTDSFSVVNVYQGKSPVLNGDGELVVVKIHEYESTGGTLNAVWEINLTKTDVNRFSYNTPDNQGYALFTDAFDFPIDYSAPYEYNGIIYDSTVDKQMVFERGHTNSANASLHVVMNYGHGFIKISAEIGTYRHVWHLMKSEVKR